jgi:hypothetical protein
MFILYGNYLKTFSVSDMIVSDHSVVETVLEARDENERMQVGAVKECIYIYIYGTGIAQSV